MIAIQIKLYFFILILNSLLKNNFCIKKIKEFLSEKKFLNYIILPSAVDLNYFNKRCFSNKINKNIITIANINPDKNILMLIDLINYIEKIIIFSLNLSERYGTPK